MDTELARLKEMIVWWEKKRIIYNVLIIGFSAFCLYTYWSYPTLKMIGGQQAILNTLVFIFGANVCYTVSWGSGIINYFFISKNYVSSKRRRWTFFILGTFFFIILVKYVFHDHI